MAAKKIAGSVLPRPLSEEAAQADKDVTTLSGSALAELLTDSALDLGVLVFDEDVARKLPLKERRAYRAAYEKAATASSDRVAWLRTIACAAALHDEGAERLRAITSSDAAWAIREITGRALFNLRPNDAASLDATATLLRIDGDAGALLQVHGLAARAILKRDRRSAFDDLTPYLSEERAHAVIAAVQWEAPHIDERWLDALLPILGTQRMNLELMVLALLVKLPSEPRMLPAVLRFIGDPAKMTFISDQTIQALGHCGDPSATPTLLRALQVGWRKDLVLEALRRIGDPAAAPAVRAYADELRGKPEAAQLAGPIELAVAVATQLERRGPAPVPAVAPAPAKLERQRRVLVPSKPRELPNDEPLEKQREALLAAFEEAGIADAANALIRPGIRLFATRTDDATIPVGATKLGGCPDLPIGAAWPHEGKQFFSFVAQLRMEELASFDHDGVLPKKGLLSFFIHDEFDEPYDFLGAVKVFLSDGPLERHDIPEGFDRRPDEHAIREPFAACTLRAQSCLLVPAPTHPLVAESIPADKHAAYEEGVYLDASSSEHQLLGYRSISYYGEVALDTVLLFQCISDDEAGMEWGDVQDLSFMMPRAALEAHDFTKVVSVMGE